MSDEFFEIALEPARKLVRITMRGHWSVQTVEEYRDAVRRAGERLAAAGCAPEQILALVDTRGGGPQSQDVIARYKALLGGAELTPRRLATLVSSALFKRQVERIAISNQRIFEDEDAALTWLFAADPA